MAISLKTFIPSKQMESVSTLQYSTTATVNGIIDKFTATNTSGAIASISVYLLLSSETVGDSNNIVYLKEIQPGESYSFPELVGHTLLPSSSIYTSGTGSALTIRCSGREVS